MNRELKHAIDRAKGAMRLGERALGRPTFLVGDRVQFAHSTGQIHGTVKRINRRTVSVTPDEPTRPGQYWRVDPGALSASDRPAPAKAAPQRRSRPVHADASKWRRGDRVEFDHPDRGTLQGTAIRINKRTITVDTDNGGRGWLVPYHLARPVTADTAQTSL